MIEALASGAPLVGLARVVLARKDVTKPEELRGKAIPSEIVDNRFAEHLDTSGFLRQLWGRELPPGK